ERGGNTRHTRNIRHVHNRGDRYVQGAYTAAEMWNDLSKVSGPDINEDLARMVIDRSEDCPTFMEAHGVRWQPPLKGSLSINRTDGVSRGGGNAVISAYHAGAAVAGIDILYESAVAEVLLDGNRARGVRVEPSARDGWHDIWAHAA